MCFPVNFAKSLRKPFVTEHLWWLPLESAHVFQKTPTFGVCAKEAEGAFN